MAGPDPAVLEQQKLSLFAVQLARLAEGLLTMATATALAMSNLLLLLMEILLLLLLPVCNISRLVWVL